MDRREFLGSSLGATAVVPNLLLPAFLSPESISRNIPDDYAAARFRNAREFMGGLEAHALQDHESFLYSAGIVTQLGLTAYLFGKGLTDDWCRDRIGLDVEKALAFANHLGLGRSEEHTSELLSLMRISYAVFCLKN